MGVIPDDQRDFLLAVAARVVPASGQLSAVEHAQMLSLIDQALASRPVDMRRQFSMFLRVLRWAPVARYGRPLDALPTERQDAVLKWFQNCPVQLIRSGFWGVRTLIMMSYYGRPDVSSRIGYLPSDMGNAVLHARTRR